MVENCNTKSIFLKYFYSLKNYLKTVNELNNENDQKYEIKIP